MEFNGSFFHEKRTVSNVSSHRILCFNPVLPSTVSARKQQIMSPWTFAFLASMIVCRCATKSGNWSFTPHIWSQMLPPWTWIAFHYHVWLSEHVVPWLRYVEFWDFLNSWWPQKKTAKRSKFSTGFPLGVQFQRLFGHLNFTENAGIWRVGNADRRKCLGLQDHLSALSKLTWHGKKTLCMSLYIYIYIHIHIQNTAISVIHK